MSDSTPPGPPQDPPPGQPPGQPPGVPPVPAAPIPPAGQPWAGYGQPPGGYLPVAQTSGKAVAILVLGIASLVSCLIPGIVALAMSGGAKREIAASGGRLSGEGFIKGGVICSWVSIGLTVAFILFFIVVIALSAAVESDFDDTGRGIQSTMAWLRP